MTRFTVLHNHPIHYSHLLFSALSSAGAAMDVIFAARTSDERTPSLQPSATNYRSDFLWEGSFQSLPQLRTAVRVVAQLERCRPDVLAISGYSYLPAWSALIWAKLHRKPVAFWSETNREYRKRRLSREFIKRLFVGLCDAGHVYGKSSREYLEDLGMDSSVIVEKRAVVDTALFSKRRAAFHKDFRRFIYVGRFAPQKNLVRLFEAFRTLRDSQRAELLLVGYGPLEPELRMKCKQLGLESSVVFAGAKTQEGVSDLLAESDCLVLPSLSEPWGLVVNEAQCAGLPVIASDRCGCVSDLINADTGWVVEAESTTALAGTMTIVCNLPVAHLQKMGEAARALSEQYSPEAGATRLLKDVARLAAKRHHAMEADRGRE